MNSGGDRYQTMENILGRLKQVRKWNGNYLINAAPRADGAMPDAFYERMAGLAALGGFAKLDAEWAMVRSTSHAARLLFGAFL